MSETVATAAVEISSSVQNEAISELSEGLEKIAVEAQSLDPPAGNTGPSEQQRLRIIYNRRQLVHLSQSQLVKPPDGMPSFKAWFGYVSAPHSSVRLSLLVPPFSREWNEQNGSAKKEAEATNANGGLRERRSVL